MVSLVVIILDEIFAYYGCRDSRTRFIDEEKSGYLAHHGNTEPPEDGVILEGLGGVRTRDDQYAYFPPPRLSSLERTQSYNSRAGSARINNASGIKIEEKGRDIHLVSWWGDNDSENPRNWQVI